MLYAALKASDAVTVRFLLRFPDYLGATEDVTKRLVDPLCVVLGENLYSCLDVVLCSLRSYADIELARPSMEGPIHPATYACPDTRLGADYYGG